MLSMSNIDNNRSWLLRRHGLTHHSRHHHWLRRHHHGLRSHHHWLRGRHHHRLRGHHWLSHDHSLRLLGLLLMDLNLLSRGLLLLPDYDNNDNNNDESDTTTYTSTDGTTCVWSGATEGAIIVVLPVDWAILPCWVSVTDRQATWDICGRCANRHRCRRRTIETPCVVILFRRCAILTSWVGGSWCGCSGNARAVERSWIIISFSGSAILPSRIGWGGNWLKVPLLFPFANWICGINNGCLIRNDRRDCFIRINWNCFIRNNWNFLGWFNASAKWWWALFSFTTHWVEEAFLSNFYFARIAKVFLQTERVT